MTKFSSFIDLKEREDLNFGIMSGDEDFFSAVSVEIGNDRWWEAIGVEFDRIFFRQMKPSLSKREISLVLKNR